MGVALPATQSLVWPCCTQTTSPPSFKPPAPPLQDNTGLVEVGFVESGPAAGWHLLRMNDTAHLVAEGVAAE
jgi:hypothetical protein